MGDQLYFTWSFQGYGVTPGQRVRAASKRLADVQSDRVQAFMRNYLPYTLPKGTDQYAIDPNDAPLSLTLVDTKWGRILLQRKYTGLDKIGRGGAFFSHLVTDLPQVIITLVNSETKEERQAVDDFLAKDAIKLWRSDFWKDSEQDMDPGQLKLKEVESDDLVVGSLNEQEVVKVKEWLPFVIQAFLTLPSPGSQKRLYIAAEPDIVARLIWGLTRALPRFLRIMRDLTFSVYEHDVEKAIPMIVGTCWRSSDTSNGRASRINDLPLSCYQGSGLAVNCYPDVHLLPSKGRSALQEGTDEADFAEFVTQCFLVGEMGQLDEIIAEAEWQNITEVSNFLTLYKTSQKELDREGVTKFLWEFIEWLRSKSPEIGLSREQKEILVQKTRILKRDNVLRSIIKLIAAEPAWWGEGRKAVVTLKQYADSSRDYEDLASALTALAMKAERYMPDLLQSNDQWLVGIWSDVLSVSLPASGRARVLTPLLQDLVRIPYTVTYASWWENFGQGWLTQARQVANQDLRSELAFTLRAYAEQVAGRLFEVIQGGESKQNEARFWTGVLATVAPGSTEPTVWVYVIKMSSEMMRKIPANQWWREYKKWWAAHGESAFSQLRTYADLHRENALAAELHVYGIEVENKLREAIFSNWDTTPFWGRVLNVSAPVSSDQNVWVSLLRDLANVPYTPAYEEWWRTYGKEALSYLYSHDEKDEVVSKLSSFIESAAERLRVAIRDNVTQNVTFCEEVLATAAPVAKLASVWSKLLEKFQVQIQHMEAFQQWWDGTGQSTVKQLHLQVRQQADSRLQNALTTFAKRRLADFKTALESSNEDKTFLLGDVWLTVDLVVWFDLLREMPGKMITSPIYQKWWTRKGKEALRTLLRLMNEHPQTGLAKDCAAAGKEVAQKLRSCAREDNREAALYWMETLQEVAPPEREPSLWIEFFQSLLSSLSQSACEVYSWELRAKLLSIWSTSPIIEELGIAPNTTNSNATNKKRLQQWLELRWSELERFLALGLPESWCNIALKGLITNIPDIMRGQPIHNSPFDITSQQLVQIVSRHASRFGEVLYQLMLVKGQMQQAALRCFGLLVAQGYSGKLFLLGKMLPAVKQDDEGARLLLGWARLEGHNEIAELLERHCTLVLSQPVLFIACVDLLRDYLRTFTVNDLERPSAIDFLSQLEEKSRKKALSLPDDLLPLMQGWYEIGEFIKEPVISINGLRDLRKTIRDMGKLPQVSVGTTAKLADKLIPVLVDHISNPLDLCRVTDDLGKVLVGENTKAIDHNLVLLERMAEVAGEKYRPEREPVKVILCAIAILQESHDLPSPEKEQFRDRCLLSLLKHADKAVFKLIEKECQSLLWPGAAEEWEEYARIQKEWWREPLQSVPDRPSFGFSWPHPGTWLEAINHWRAYRKTLNTFVEAYEMSGQVEQIVAAYQPILDKKLYEHEREIVTLAKAMVQSLESNNPDAIVLAYQNIQNSAYYLNVTPEQQVRIDQAMQGQVAGKSQVSGQAQVSRQAQDSGQVQAQRVREDNRDKVVKARVNGEEITREQTRKATEMMSAYMQYQIYLWQRQLPAKPAEEAIARWKGLLQAGSEPNSRVFEEKALNYLVEDILIRQGMATVKKGKDQRRLEQDLADKQKSLFEGVTKYQGGAKHPLLTDSEVNDVLQIFARALVFDSYLQEHKGKKLNQWLQERKHEARIQY